MRKVFVSICFSISLSLSVSLLVSVHFSSSLSLSIFFSLSRSLIHTLCLSYSSIVARRGCRKEGGDLPAVSAIAGMVEARARRGKELIAESVPSTVCSTGARGRTSHWSSHGGFRPNKRLGIKGLKREIHCWAFFLTESRPHVSLHKRRLLTHVLVNRRQQQACADAPQATTPQAGTQRRVGKVQGQVALGASRRRRRESSPGCTNCSSPQVALDTSRLLRLFPQPWSSVVSERL